MAFKAGMTYYYFQKCPFSHGYDCPGDCYYEISKKKLDAHVRVPWCYIGQDYMIMRPLIRKIWLPT